VKIKYLGGNMKIDKAELKNSILRELRRQYGKTLEEAHEFELYNAII